MTKVYIVGAGPGSPDYVTPIAKRVVRGAQLVIGSERVLELFKEDLIGETIVLTAKNVKDAIDHAVKCAREGMRVVLLSTGDPCFAGLLKTFTKLTDDVDFEVIPGISSIQVCAARLKISWDEAVLVSFHDGVDERKKSELLRGLSAGRTAMVLPEPRVFKLRDIAKFLIDNGFNRRVRVFVCENLTLEEERIIECELEEALELDVGSLCVIVIKPKEGWWAHVDL